MGSAAEAVGFVVVDESFGGRINLELAAENPGQGGGQTGGKEFVVVSLLLFMVNNRMVVAGPLYEDAEGDDVWGEAGASAMTGPLDPGVSEKELDAARRLGHRLATLARKLQSNLKIGAR